MSMRFAARDIKPYADHVRGSDLVVGRVYFRILFLDEDMAVPSLEPLVFIGRDLHVEGPGLYYQDPPSYLANERFDAMQAHPLPLSPTFQGTTWERNGCWFDMERHGDFSSVQEYDEALESLLRCSIARRTWDGVLRATPESP